MREQRSDDEIQMRRYVLETRTELPQLASRPRHIHNADYIDGDLCSCERCRRHLCGYVAQVWHPEDHPTELSWDLYWLLECPGAFADEPFCDGCLRALGKRTARRTPEELRASESNAPVGDALTWIPPNRRGGRPKTRTMEWAAIRKTWPTIGATRPASHERA